MSDEPETSSSHPVSLTGTENVLRHQLNVIDYWMRKTAETEEKNEKAADDRSLAGEAHGTQDYSLWKLSRGFDLRDWQIACRDEWFAAGKKGVAKVVTGAGKTVFALSLIERLQNEECPDLRVIIVAPTIVLQSQWYDLIRCHSNLPVGAIGRLGGGFRDRLEGDCRILVCVLNSAASYLPKMKSRFADKLFLIVDECHRSGSKQMSNIFAVERAYTIPETTEAKNLPPILRAMSPIQSVR